MPARRTSTPKTARTSAKSGSSDPRFEEEARAARLKMQRELLDRNGHQLDATLPGFLWSLQLNRDDPRDASFLARVLREGAAASFVRDPGDTSMPDLSMAYAAMKAVGELARAIYENWKDTQDSAAHHEALRVMWNRAPHQRSAMRQLCLLDTIEEAGRRQRDGDPVGAAAHLINVAMFRCSPQFVWLDATYVRAQLERLRPDARQRGISPSRVAVNLCLHVKRGPVGPFGIRDEAHGRNMFQATLRRANAGQ